MPQLSPKSTLTEIDLSSNAETLEEKPIVDKEFMREMSTSLEEIKEENEQLKAEILELEAKVIFFVM